MRNKSELEALFSLQCKAHKLAPVTEYRFHPLRKWRFDFAFPDRMVAVEVEGAVWTNGRHTRGSGYIKDCEKYNNAAALGWFVFRFDGGAVTRGDAINFMLQVLRQNAPHHSPDHAAASNFEFDIAQNLLECTWGNDYN